MSLSYITIAEKQKKRKFEPRINLNHNIYTLSDLADLSNLTGLLSCTIQQYSPPSKWIMCELGVFPITLTNPHDVISLNGQGQLCPLTCAE